MNHTNLSFLKKESLKTNLPVFLFILMMICCFVLVYLEIKLIFPQRLIFKSLTSLLMILIALSVLISKGIKQIKKDRFFAGIITALVISAIADVVLVFRDVKVFLLLGLFLFLAAHMVYTIIFSIPFRFKKNQIIILSIFLIIAAFIYYLLRDHLGAMQVPVIIYMLVICLMVSSALSLDTKQGFSTGQLWLIAIGVILFFISDIILALSLFRYNWPYNRLSLLAYYAGQGLIGLSLSCQKTKI